MRNIQYLTPVQKHKRPEKPEVLLGELKAGTTEREIVCFMFKNCSQLKQLLTTRATESRKNRQQTLNHFVRTVYGCQKIVSLMLWAAVPK